MKIAPSESECEHVFNVSKKEKYCMYRNNYND